MDRDNERGRQDRVEAADRSTEPLSFAPSAIRVHKPGENLVRIEMMLGELRVGTVLLEERKGDTLWIADIWVVDGLKRRGYGRRAVDLLKATAQAEGYKRLAGQIEPGSPEVMRGRRAFFQGCAFTVAADDIELVLSGGSAAERLAD